VIPKVGLSYAISGDHLVYFQAAQGFRSGGPNLQFTLGVGKQAIDSDSLWNYEIGAKTSWLGGALLANASIYYIDWSDMQTNQFALSPVTGAVTGFLDNGGDARIVGGELFITAAPADGWLLGLNLGVNDSKVTRGAGGITEGEELANLPEITASAYAQYSFPVRDIGNAYVRFSYEHADKQATRLLSATSNGFFIDGYDIGHLRAGLEGGNGLWGLDVFVNNIWDERAELGRGLSSVSSVTSANVVTIIQPRTIGVSLRKSF
jgi:outer membrane receptor protein involved in Fe transport